jgi:GGDEF domain-containing protein
MSEQFIDTIAEHITGAIQQEIGEQLFDQWSANNLDEGEAYAEFMFMRFASDELKQQYNEYYGYIEGDEFLL